MKSTQKDLAEYYYALAQKDKKPENYASAARWYRAMLDSFPQDPEAPANRFVLGEVLFESGRFAEAAKNTKRLRTTIRRIRSPRRRVMPRWSRIRSTSRRCKVSPKAVWHQQGIESALMFATSFPEHPESARVQTKANEDLFALNDFERVIEVSTLILERNPPVERKLARSATTLLAHSLFDRGRFGEAEAAYLKVQGFLPAERSGSRQHRRAHRCLHLQTSRSEAHRGRFDRCGR